MTTTESSARLLRAWGVSSPVRAGARTAVHEYSCAPFPSQWGGEKTTGGLAGRRGYVPRMTSARTARLIAAAPEWPQEGDARGDDVLDGVELGIVAAVAEEDAE